MMRHSIQLAIVVAFGLGALAVVPGLRGGEQQVAREALTAEDAARLWSPKIKGTTDYQYFGGPAEEATDVAAYTFRVVGPTFQELWTHYAGLCGIEKPFKEKNFLNTSGAGPKGRYVLSERPSGDGKGGRGPSVFLLKTDKYTVSVTIQPDPGGESISGSLTAIVP